MAQTTDTYSRQNMINLSIPQQSQTNSTSASIATPVISSKNQKQLPQPVSATVIETSTPSTSTTPKKQDETAESATQYTQAPNPFT